MSNIFKKNQKIIISEIFQKFQNKKHILNKDIQIINSRIIFKKYNTGILPIYPDHSKHHILN